jgi:hypothetical protein
MENIMEMESRKKSIDKVFKRRNRIEMPDIQREEVWPLEKKQLLIDTILRGWHLPKFYFRKVDNDLFECIDGQQRLVAIYEFFQDRLEVNAETFKRIGVRKYSKLPENISDKFDDYEIDIEEIVEASEKELEMLFLRLQFGTPLNTAEKLNAINGELKDFCKKSANHTFFKKKVTLKNARYSHFEIVTRWAHAEAKGVGSQMRFRQLESFLQENREFSDKSTTALNVKKALKYLNEAFDSESPYLRNKANVLSICMLASRVVSNGLDKNTALIFGKFIKFFFDKLAIEIEKGVKSTDKEILRYQQAITSASADQESISTRISILTKSIASYSAKFSPLIGIYPDAKAEANKDIVEQASLAKEIIHKINTKYSAASGEDLFKMTNKTVLALDKISKNCDSKESYGELIDNLYFLVYEGSGSCARLPVPVPEFAIDIKKLRTGLRHDVDHGDKKSISKKNIEFGKVFGKYSDKSSPELLSPAEFISVQNEIMRELVVFLRRLE